MFLRCFASLLVVLGLALPGCKKPAGTARPGAPEVLVTQVVQRDVPIFREWLGNLDGSVNTQVRARVSGYLVSQNYKEGSQVREGELLFQIDPRPLEAALNQAKGDLARAQATERLASLNVTRARELFQTQVISAQERDTSTANYRTAQADVRAQQAAVQTAQLNLEFAQITSPVNGIAGIANAQIGDLVGPNSAQTGPLTTVSSVDPIKAFFTITEQDYIGFARRNPQEVTHPGLDWQGALQLILADGSVYSCKGQFYFADRQVDVNTGSMRVAGLFPNPQTLLRPGLFCRVRTQTGVREGALLVPERAVAEVQGAHQVAVVGADRRVSIRPVQVAERVKGWRVVTQGIRLGETVVVEGLQKARDGAGVEPKPWRGAEAGGP